MLHALGCRMWWYGGAFILSISAARDAMVATREWHCVFGDILTPSLSPTSLPYENKDRLAWWPACFAFIAYLGRGLAVNPILPFRRVDIEEMVMRDGRGAEDDDCYAD